MYVHRLVLETFAGPNPDGMECCHNDGNASNNRLDNLRWDTRKANIHDAIRHMQERGQGRGHPLKLCNEQAKAILDLKGKGLTQREVALMFEVDASLIGLIWRGKLWKHVSDVCKTGG
jgi:hypothetical protein